MPLTNEQKKHYKSIGHHLKPVLIVSENGLTEGVQAGLVRFDFWLQFSYLVIALGGLMLVVQPPPGRER